MNESTLTAMIAAMRALLDAFGPVGALALLVATVVAWVYRRDILRSRAHACEAFARAEGRQDHLLQLVERNAAAAMAVQASNEALAATIARLADTMHENEAVRARSIELLVAALRDRRT